MPRAPEDDLALVTWGPGTATPGVVKGIMAGRYVPQDQITCLDPWAFSAQAYFVSYANIASAGVWMLAPPLYQWDESTADRLQIITKGGIIAIATRVLLIAPPLQLPYERVDLFIP